MSCETRIVRVLGTLKYPGAGNLSAQSLLQNPGELARVVSWIEDQKVMEHHQAPCHVYMATYHQISTTCFVTDASSFRLLKLV